MCGSDSVGAELAKRRRRACPSDACYCAERAGALGVGAAGQRHAAGHVTARLPLCVAVKRSRFKTD